MNRKLIANDITDALRNREKRGDMMKLVVRSRRTVGLLLGTLSLLLLLPVAAPAQDILANTAYGVNALEFDTSGFQNAAFGISALQDNNGWYNTANGFFSLWQNDTGFGNTANGYYTLSGNSGGSYNIALGYQAGYNITGSNNIAIGNQGASTDSGVIRIGTSGTHAATYIAGIHGVTLSKGVTVYIDAQGRLGTLTSSRRFKHDIHDMGNVSEKLMQLRPVTFRYNDSAETGPHSLQYGLIAEEVAKVYPDLVQYDKQGKPFTVYYHLLAPMLLNELQKEHRRDEAQNGEIAALNSMLQQERAELASLRAAQQQQAHMLSKLSAYVQASHNKETVQGMALTSH